MENQLSLAWAQWLGEHTLTGRTYLEFYLSEIQSNANYDLLNVFEVLDFLVNFLCVFLQRLLQ